MMRAVDRTSLLCRKLLEYAQRPLYALARPWMCQVGDRIRTPRGAEIQVSHNELSEKKRSADSRIVETV